MMRTCEPFSNSILPPYRSKPRRSRPGRVDDKENSVQLMCHPSLPLVLAHLAEFELPDYLEISLFDVAVCGRKDVA